MPRASEISDAELLDRLMDVFRCHGYEGATLSLLARATGLGRASLYHRFPGGKPEMAEAALKRAEEILAARALDPLDGPGAPRERVRAMGEALGTFYDEGRRSCLLDTLSLGDENDVIRAYVRGFLTRWIDALARVASDAGLSPRTARERAQDAIAGIQGALILSRATGDTGPFDRVIGSLPRALTSADDPDGCAAEQRKRGG